MGLFDAIAGIGGSLIGAGASIYGAEQAADAAKKAGKVQMQQYQQAREDYEPWRQVGIASLSDLRDLILGGDFSKFQASPGYQFRMDEGRKAIDRSAAARGSLNSGATLKALDDYGQNMASNEFGNYLNNLYGLAGFGRQATQDVAGLGANAAQGYGQGIANAGYLRGTGYAGAANTLNQGIGNYMGMNYLNQLLAAQQGN